MADLRTIRIFISSPSDVRPERLRAEQIIARLDREFAYHFHIEAVLWEREPLLATHHFQDERNIPRPSAADIVVVILWSQLGLVLPQDRFRGTLSGRAVTGTEWEFEDALASAREQGSPDLLLYRKTARVAADLDDEDRLNERRAQRALVHDFLARWFRAEDGGEYTAALHNFETATDFEERLYEHLRELLERRAGAHAEGVEIRWHKPPFRSLLPFEYEHAPVFFGRTRARNELRELLARQEARGCAFVLVLGASGSGKSSLVKAGLLPDLTLPGMIGRVAVVRHASLRPSDRPDDITGALAAAILSDDALPELTDLHYTTESLAGLLSQAPDQAGLAIRQGLSLSAKEQHLPEIAESRLVILLDQLEELFTLDGIAAQFGKFVAAIDALARSGLVWVVATMRSDFYDRLELIPELARLAANEACFRLQAPSDAELGHIIRQPVREAGLHFGVDPRAGISLDEAILQVAARDRAALPLLSFLLDQLWQRRTAQGELTFSAYEELGGLEGALGRRAEESFAALHPEVQTALPRLLRALVTVGQGAQPTVGARPAPIDGFPKGSAERQLIAAFLSPEARLLVADEDEGGNASPRIRVAHEAILTHWERARAWIAERPADLRLEEELEAETVRWSAARDKDRKSLLRAAGLPLTEAEDLAARRGSELSPAAHAFIAASGRHARRRQRMTQAAAVTFGVIAAISIALGIFARQQGLLAERNYKIATRAASGLVFDIAEGLRNAQGLSAGSVRRILDTAERVTDRLAESSPNDPELKWTRVAMLRDFARTYGTVGDLPSASAAAEESLKLARALTAEGNANPHELALSLLQAGNIHRVEGDRENARRLLEESRAVITSNESAGKRKETNAGDEAIQAFLMIGDNSVTAGDQSGALVAYEECLSVARKGAADAAEAAKGRWELGISRCLERIGNVRSNEEWALSPLVNLEVLRRAPGSDLEGGSAAYEESLQIRRRLAEQNPENTDQQYFLWEIFIRIGVLRAYTGDWAAALAMFDDSLSVIGKLAATDPENLFWQRMVGVSLQRIGDVHFNQGDWAAAAEPYGKALAITRKLAAEAPGNTQFQRDLGRMLVRIAAIRAAAGDMAQARAGYAESLQIARALAAKDPGHAQWRLDIVWALFQMSKVLSPQETQAALKEGKEILDRLDREGKLTEVHQEWRRIIQKAVSEVPSAG